MDLTGQVALITGSSRGLGRAFAQALAAAGARVAITARSPQQLQDTATEIAPTPGQVLALAADVTDPDATQQIVSRVDQQLGAITLLINNAGVFRAFGPIDAVDPTAWWQEIEVNLRGPFLYTHAVLPAMQARHN
jgi:NAD(P)-dependent dehydrogenase (short-subunit alcohol dehydrogenase family)